MSKKEKFESIATAQPHLQNNSSGEECSTPFENSSGEKPKLTTIQSTKTPCVEPSGVLENQEVLFNPSDEYLLWLDVETTGLDAFAPNAHLLQVAAILSDSCGNTIGEVKEWVVKHTNSHEIRLNSITYVKEMHDKTGLWDRLQNGTPLQQVDNELTALIRSVSSDPTKVRLAGNSIRLDLNFMEAFLPQSYSSIHYRSLDVSALSYALKEWGILDEYYEKRGTHNAVDDINESIQEYKYVQRKTVAFRELAQSKKNN